MKSYRKLAFLFQGKQVQKTTKTQGEENCRLNSPKGLMTQIDVGERELSHLNIHEAHDSEDTAIAYREAIHSSSIVVAWESEEA